MPRHACLAPTQHSLCALPQIERGSLFPAACLSLYVMYMCYSALQSEPHDYECNRLGQRLNAASAGTLATGMLLTLLRCVCVPWEGGWMGWLLLTLLAGCKGPREPNACALERSSLVLAPCVRPPLLPAA